LVDLQHEVIPYLLARLNLLGFLRRSNERHGNALSV
jgi:hypothetical protein